jgi:glycerol kinase
MIRATGIAEIVEAAKESIAYQIADVVNMTREEAGIGLLTLRAADGTTRDECLIQFQSDILDLLPVYKNGVTTDPRPLLSR